MGKSSIEGISLAPEKLASHVRSAITWLGFDDSYVFGHSLGGTLALLMESSQPTFKSVYCYEPVVSTPDRAQQLRSQAATPPAANRLSQLSRKRRSHWPSSQEALASMSSRPPFSGFHPEALHAYATHGLEAAPGGGVQLVCAPSLEAGIFEIMAVPPTLNPALLTCPIAIAVGGGADPLHADLANMGVEVAASLPNAELIRITGVAHLAPMTHPELVAQSVKRWFDAQRAKEARSRL